METNQFTKKIAAITIGQSPREDVTGDILGLLDENIQLIEYGVLDGYTLDEVEEKFAPRDGNEKLATRMKDGSQVIIDSKLVHEKMQEVIDQIEDDIHVILLLCTGSFPEIKSKKPLIVPRLYVNSLVKTFSEKKKIGVLVPEISQKNQIKRLWEEIGLDAEIIAISPYLESESIKDKILVFKNRKDIDCIVLDCMGYSKAMKDTISKATNKTVILPRTFIVRLINELV